MTACHVETSDAALGPETNGAPATGLELRGVRRLSEAEYRATLAELLGAAVPAEPRLPPAPRQHGFSRNTGQIVDALSATAYHELATSAASAAVRGGSVAELRECSAEVERECAARVVRAFGRRAFRRPLTDAEAARYLALYDVGAEMDEPLAGLELAIGTLLESPFLVYAQALGLPADEPGVVRLTSHEVASELSYAIAAAPPDAELSALADRHALFEPRVREREARRLFRKSETRFQYRRFVDEWLELDRLSQTAKDSRVHPDFVARRDAMAKEAWDFVDRAMVEANGAFSALVAGEAGERVGLLESPAFLAVHAHPTSSAPVLRGVAVLERVLCRDFPTPAELGIEVTAPPPDPNATTRARFEAHARDPACSSCHAEIDPVGGAFEGFDAVGDVRSEDAGRAVDTTGSVRLDGRDVPLANSHELARALAESDEAARCLARQVVRYLGGRDDEPVEQAFADDAAALPRERRTSLVELSVFYVASERFVWRRSEP